MIQSEVTQELKRYGRISVYSALVLFAIKSLMLIISYSNGWLFLIQPIFGAFLGCALATVNLFAIGYSFYAFNVLKRPRWALSWPVMSFIAMCALAFVLSKFEGNYVLGFAFGLTAPVFFGGVIIFGSTKPA